MSIESHLVSLRTYLEEVASQNKEILAELKRINTPQQAAKPANKPQTAATVEKQLEAETGHDFVRTSSNPVTLAESDKPAPGTKKGK